VLEANFFYKIWRIKNFAQILQYNLTRLWQQKSNKENKTGRNSAPKSSKENYLRKGLIKNQRSKRKVMRRRMTLRMK